MPRKVATKAGKKTGRKAGTLVPQKHGGTIWKGAPANPVAGPGRPPEAIRQAMRELGAAKGVPFLSDVLDGKIAVSFVGTCPHCREESKPTTLDLVAIVEKVQASVDQRLKANEQALKYGLGTKDEVSLTDHPQWQSRMTALRAALVEIVGDETATQVILRADELARR